MNNQTSPPYCSSHICSSNIYDTAGAEFQLVHMHLFVHFVAHSAFYPLIYPAADQKTKICCYAPENCYCVFVKLVEELK